jgi:hypothetical protein
VSQQSRGKGKAARRSSTGRSPEATTSPRQHIVDAIFFRVLAVWLLTEMTPRAGTMELAAVFFGLFFMPDALRGRHALVLDMVRKMAGRG